MDEFVSTAMVVTFGDGEILFVDQENESPYYPTLPEDAPELTAGNIVRVHRQRHHAGELSRAVPRHHQGSR
mgnify:CR=1 FL=1